MDTQNDGLENVSPFIYGHLSPHMWQASTLIHIDTHDTYAF